MGKLKQIAFFLAVILLIGSIGCIFFWDNVAQWIYVLRWGHGEREYIRISSDADGTICAAYWNSPNELALRFFDTDGKNVRSWVPNLPDDAEQGYLANLYPAGNDTAFLAFYEQDSSFLSVYRAKANGTAERLLHVAPEKLDERYSPFILDRYMFRLGTFSRQQDEVRFTLLRSSFELDVEALDLTAWCTVTAYACPVEGGGLRLLTEEKIDTTSMVYDLSSAAVLPNGGLVMAGAELLTIDGRPVQADLSGQYITQLALSGNSIYYLDRASGMIYYSDLNGTRVQQVLNLNGKTGALQLTDRPPVMCCFWRMDGVCRASIPAGPHPCSTR